MGKGFLLVIASAFLLMACDTGEGAKAPPHIILFIGDGMGYGSEIAASRYIYGRADGLAWRNFPFQAWATTWDKTSYDSHAAALAKPAYDAAAPDPSLGYDAEAYGAEPWPLSSDTAGELAYLIGAATDSAASATAMATGQKAVKGSLSSGLETIAELMRSRLGARIGLVSTVPFDHATPAAFMAHFSSRGDYADIAKSLTVDERPDLLIGGGHPSWNSSYYGLAALESLRASGLWHIAERRIGDEGAAGLAAAEALGDDKGLFGLFGGVDGAMENPMPANVTGAPSFTLETENPSLAAATLMAARRLSRGGKGFFLVAEQGDIDWANHANDLPRMIGAVYGLDEAVRALCAWVDESGDDVDWGNTLLIVTADHATGLPRFDATRSSEMLKGELPAETTATIPAAYSYSSGLVLSYSTGGHGNELVTLAARGDRAFELFSGRPSAYGPPPSLLDDTDIYLVMRAFAGL